MFSLEHNSKANGDILYTGLDLTTNDLSAVEEIQSYGPNIFKVFVSHTLVGFSWFENLNDNYFSPFPFVLYFVPFRS